jgi:hypothetical protein
MRTAGLLMNDVWADRALRDRGVEAHRYDGLDAEIRVLVDSVELKHRGKDVNYRPYLHVAGELRSITPSEPLPYGITEVTYSPGQGEKVDAYYEFDDEQLHALVGKGYFSTSFAVPERLTGIEWELPATVDALVLSPSSSQADAPVVFMNVHRIADLEIDLGSTQYDLSAYFPEHPYDGRSAVEAHADERGLRARSEAIDSLFSQDEVDSARAAGAGPSAVEQERVAGGIEARLQQVEAEIAAEHDRYRAELERTEGTPQHLYHERVAQALRADELEVARTDDLDFGPEDDPTVAAAVAPTLDERKREASRRAADLDFGEDGRSDLAH